MKKISKVAALLAASALLFGGMFLSCSDSDDGDSTGGGSSTTKPTPTPTPTPESEITGTTYAWTFNDITTDGINAVDAGGELAGKLVLAADYKYNSTPAGLALTMGKGDASQGFVYNKIDPAMAIGSNQSVVKEKGASVGAVEPAGELLTIKNVKGPFKVLAYVSGNSSSDKTDRYAYIKIGDEEVCAPTKSSNTVPAAGQELSYSYTGTDKVTVVIGCAKYLRVYDIKITSSAEQDQSDGTTVTFTPQSDNSTANTVDTLGLVGTSVAPTGDAGTAANAVIEEGKIKVTSKAEGTETITVTNADGKTASFKAIVAEDGSITISAITKYARPAPVAGTPTAATSADAKDGSVTLTLDGLSGDLEFSLDETTWVTEATVKTSIATFTVSTSGTTATVSGLPVGTYYVRYAATTAYAASASTSVAISAAAAAGGNEGATAFTEYFDSYKKDNAEEFTSVTDSSWTVLSTNTSGASNDTTFKSGIVIHTGKTGDFKVKTSTQKIGDYTCKAMIQFPKSSAGQMTIPVKGNCTINIPWGNNKAGSAIEKGEDRGLLATVSATGATIKTASGTAGTSAFYSNPNIAAGTYEVISFVYTGGEGNVVITCNKSASEAAGGACYIGLVDVIPAN